MHVLITGYSGDVRMSVTAIELTLLALTAVPPAMHILSHWQARQARP